MADRVTIVCGWLFDDLGENITVGGSERYVIELMRLLKSNGWTVRIIQKARRSFERSIEGVRVTGIESPPGWKGMFIFSRKVKRKLCASDLAIYVTMPTAFPCTHQPSIAVQHGIEWSGDDRMLSLFNTYRLHPHWMRHIDAVVCVDTAYINWLYASVPGRLNYAHKLWYVPNFVDNARHMKQASWEAVEGRTTILFPRRMEIRRGPLLLLEALEKLWAAGRSYRVVFCGPGQCSEEVRRRAQRLGVYDRVTITERSFEEMPGEYSRSQLAVIPTVAYEGTSLSCIEAMASGCPVVVTHVGGLGNLVIPGFNGLCVDLRADDLAASIERVLSDQALWMELAENGRKTAAALDIDRWRVEWLRVIHSVSSRQHPTALVLE